MGALLEEEYKTGLETHRLQNPRGVRGFIQRDGRWKVNHCAIYDGYGILDDLMRERKPTKGIDKKAVRVNLFYK